MAKHFQPRLTKGPQPSGAFLHEDDRSEHEKKDPLVAVPIDDVIHSGTVVRYLTDKRFGFIQPHGGQEIFVHYGDVLEDSVGRKQLFTNARVQFQIGRKPGETRQRAVNVRVLTADADPSTYRETSLITRWIDDGFGRGHGLARRPCGGTVALTTNDVIEGDASSLHVGSKVNHGVCPPSHDQKFWNATEIEIYTPAANPWDEVVADPEVKPIERNDASAVSDVTPTEKPTEEASTSGLFSQKFKSLPLRRIGIRPDRLRIKHT